MAESAIFLIIILIIIVPVMYVFNMAWIDPRIILALVIIAILPGLYASVSSGPFVPSGRKRHRKMIEIADLKSDDIVYDIGCGDGRLVFNAAPYVKKAIGYELSIPLYLFSKFKSLFKSENSEIRFGDIWKQDYKDADVIFCYLLPGSMKRFYKVIWPTLALGTRVVSNSFQIHDLKPIKKDDKIYLYKKISTK